MHRNVVFTVKKPSCWAICPIAAKQAGRSSCSVSVGSWICHRSPKVCAMTLHFSVFLAHSVVLALICLTKATASGPMRCEAGEGLCMKAMYQKSIISYDSFNTFDHSCRLHLKNSSRHQDIRMVTEAHTAIRNLMVKDRAAFREACSRPLQVRAFAVSL